MDYKSTFHPAWVARMEHLHGGPLRWQSLAAVMNQRDWQAQARARYRKARNTGLRTKRAWQRYDEAREADRQAELDQELAAREKAAGY
jgi:hypothetical protein